MEVHNGPWRSRREPSRSEDRLQIQTIVKSVKRLYVAIVPESSLNTLCREMAHNIGGRWHEH